MTLTEMFQAVANGSFYQRGGWYLWICPVCYGHVVQTKSGKDRDRSALEHCLTHRLAERRVGSPTLEHCVTEVSELANVGGRGSRRRELAGGTGAAGALPDILRATGALPSEFRGHRSSSRFDDPRNIRAA